MTKQEKAKQLRYKKAILDDFNLESICTELEEISYNCEEIRWVIDGEEGTLIAALDGDDEEAFEFRMGFSELDAECEELYDLLHGEYVTEYFDNFLTGISDGSGMRLVGYDDYEADYYGLIGYDETLGIKEAKKRIERLTKQQIISAANQAFRVLMCFLNIRYRYDYLKASFDVLKGENTSFLDSIRQIEKEYDDIMTHGAEDTYSVREDRERHFDMLTAALPDKVWVE